MRITTRAIMQSYNYNLTNALKNWNTAQTKVLTQRNFSTIAEDPSSATRSFKLRQQFRTNNMQLEMAQQSETLLDQAVSSTMQISDIMCNTVNPDILKAVNATNSSLDVRKSYAASLRGMADSIVLAANSQISGRYIFGGASTKEVPFEMDADGNFTYRGVNVDATDKDLYLDKDNKPIFLDADGKEIAYDTYTPTTTYYDADGTKITVDGTTIKEEDGKLVDGNGDPVEYAKKETVYTLEKNGQPVAGTFKAVEDADGNGIELSGMKSQRQVLDELANETLYVDIGFGLEGDADGNVVSTSAYNTAVPGLSMLGYGKDENGNSNNVVVLLGQLANVLEQEKFDENEYNVLMSKFDECVDQITDFESTLGTKQNFLEGTVTRLEQYNDAINNRVVDLEQVDMAEAISTYTWMGYAYNAALKVGTDIVSNSLLDYMK